MIYHGVRWPPDGRPDGVGQVRAMDDDTTFGRDLPPAIAAWAQADRWQEADVMRAQLSPTVALISERRRPWLPSCEWLSAS